MENNKSKYVTFEQAQFLKEKGFNVYQPNQYSKGVNPKTLYNYTEEMCKLYDDVFFAPELRHAVEWLFDFYNIDISVIGKLPYIVFPDSECGEGELQWHFEYKIIQNIDGQKCEVIESNEWFDSRQEAYSGAFDYIRLKKLI